jgi:hypothetical protein
MAEFGEELGPLVILVERLQLELMEAAMESMAANNRMALKARQYMVAEAALGRLKERHRMERAAECDSVSSSIQGGSDSSLIRMTRHILPGAARPKSASRGFRQV